MIVFFAAIREILKREIYRDDKKTSRCDENKELAKTTGRGFLANHEFGSSGLWMRYCVRLVTKRRNPWRRVRVADRETVAGRRRLYPRLPVLLMVSMDSRAPMDDHGNLATI